jgi:uncharacterized protein (DUF305 family)
MRRQPIKELVFGCAVIALAACSSATATSQQPTVMTPQPVSTNAAAIQRAREDSVNRPYTEADVRFMTMMIPHHAQALQMSRWVPTHGASPAIQRLAERIINAQQDEITTMQQWLVDRQKPLPDLGPAGHNHHAGHNMHGMLTEAQLQQLNAARGTEFDRLFLTYMIQHHRGAVGMVKELFGTGGGQDETVFKFASDVNVDQTTEIVRMEQMLSTLTNQQKE